MGMLGNDPKVNATFTATDKASPVIKSLRGEVSKLGSKTGGPLGGLLSGLGGLSVGMVGLVGAGVGAVGLMGDFANKAIEDQQNVEHLTTALKANVDGWDGNTDAIDAFIKKGQDLAFTDDDIRDSLAQLITRTHDVNKAIGLTREAMDLARLKNMKLVDAAGLLGKVYSGQTAAARKAGIAIDKNADSTQALAQIQKAAAGQADTYANSAVGTLDKLADQWSEFTEGLGYAALALVDQVGNLGTAFDNLHRFIDPNYAAMEDSRKAAIEAAGAFGLTAEAIDAFIAQQKAAHDTAQQLVDDAYNEKKNQEFLAQQYGITVDQLKEMQGAQNDAGRAAEDHALAVANQTDYLAQYIDDMRESNTLTQRNTEALNANKKGREGWFHATHDAAVGLKMPLVNAENALRNFEGAWRGAAINIPHAIETARIATHKQFKSLLAQDKADLKQLIHDINHPGEDKNLLHWLPKAMKRAQHALHVAQKNGDAVAIQEAKDLITRLNAQFALLHGPTTIGVHVVGGGSGRTGARVRAGGGPVQGGNTYLVGENGPELLHLSGNNSGFVTQGRGAGSGNGGTHVTNVYLNGDLIAKQVDQYQGRNFALSGSGLRN